MSQSLWFGGIVECRCVQFPICVAGKTSTTLYAIMPLPTEKVSYSQCRCAYLYHARLIVTWVSVPVSPARITQGFTTTEKIY